MKGRDAGALEGARRSLGIKRIAVAGVGIGDDRHSTASAIEAKRSAMAVTGRSPRSGTPVERAIAPPLA